MIILCFNLSINSLLHSLLCLYSIISTVYVFSNMNIRLLVLYFYHHFSFFSFFLFKNCKLCKLKLEADFMGAPLAAALLSAALEEGLVFKLDVDCVWSIK